MRCKERQRPDSGWLAGITWVIIVLTMSSLSVADESAEAGASERALACIQDSMARVPPPWPDAWRQEYVQTIREAATSHQETPHYDTRLTILCNGFRPYWEVLRRGQDRSLFEVHCAEIRWYVESLMDANLPGEEETRALRNQCAELLHFGASSLLTQFPFLDPNIVRKAEADHLTQCYQRIEAPLLPVYHCLFSQAQMEQIKERWHDLRYARVDLWRRLGGDASISAIDPSAEAINTHPYYLLTQRSLAQLQAQLWAIGLRAPDYYRTAVANYTAAQKRYLRSRSQAWSEERRLEKEYSGRLLQTEQLAFLLAALLESAQRFDESSSAQMRGNIPPSEPNSAAEGGDAHGRK